MLDKYYKPELVEQDIYKDWEENGDFNAKIDANNESFTIVIPPPNVTGNLHMGHALNNTLQDILIRYHRMQGKDVLWQPGTDHAGIAIRFSRFTKKEKGIGRYIKRRFTININYIYCINNFSRFR